MEWVGRAALGFLLSAFDAVFIGCETLEGFELVGEIVGLGK